MSPLDLSTDLADSGIPWLASVVDPHKFTDLLFPFLPSQWGNIRDIQVVVLQHQPKRSCTVDIKLLTSSGQRELIGKVYASDRASLYRAMEEISRSGFGPEADFSIPRPLAYIPQLHLVLQEKIHGQAVTEIFRNGNECERAKAAERCAGWLAHFHMHAPMSGPVFALTHEMESCANRLCKMGPPLGDKARSLFKRLERANSAISPTIKCACHGGYCHHQIIFAEARTAVFDWDNYCVANPSRDLAKFIIELQLLAIKFHGSSRALDSTIEVFNKTYTATSRFDLALSLPVYKASICIKRAKGCLRFGRSKFEKTEALLNEGLRILAEEM